mmetsp:Transcript_5051/g.12365  ORF Transcript_5051/g.12365 Transcript_5051/m.12365 type:complete len:315 (-) Transcript_5051:172-1116(-)
MAGAAFLGAIRPDVPVRRSASRLLFRWRWTREPRAKEHAAPALLPRLDVSRLGATRRCQDVLKDATSKENVPRLAARALARDRVGAMAARPGEARPALRGPGHPPATPLAEAARHLSTLPRQPTPGSAVRRVRAPCQPGVGTSFARRVRRGPPGRGGAEGGGVPGAAVVGRGGLGGRAPRAPRPPPGQLQLVRARPPRHPHLLPGAARGAPHLGRPPLPAAHCRREAPAAAHHGRGAAVHAPVPAHVLHVSHSGEGARQPGDARAHRPHGPARGGDVQRADVRVRRVPRQRTASLCRRARVSGTNIVISDACGL